MISKKQCFCPCLLPWLHVESSPLCWELCSSVKTKKILTPENILIIVLRFKILFVPLTPRSSTWSYIHKNINFLTHYQERLLQFSNFYFLLSRERLRRHLDPENPALLPNDLPWLLCWLTILHICVTAWAQQERAFTGDHWGDGKGSFSAYILSRGMIS